MPPEWLRPSAAALRFQVSVRTLERWAADRLIGRSKRGRCTWYSARDIADLIAAGSRPRVVARVVPSDAAAVRATDADLGGIWRKEARR